MLVSILNELEHYTEVERPDRSDYILLLGYASRLIGSLKWQRRFSSQLNKKNKIMKKRLKDYERLLSEEGVDFKMIKWRLTVD